jgi:hypothetical protein
MSDEISKAAAAMGRKGGASKSDAKKAAAWANGKKGGRPKKHASGITRVSATQPAENQ